jgi:hypothetical protein
MDPIDLSAPDYVLEALHWGLYDLSQLHAYSDLSASQWDANFNAEAAFSSAISGIFNYTYLDYNDSAPYLEKLSGTLSIVSLGLRWAF